MTVDDVFEYLACMPTKDRPVALRTAGKMLSVWIFLRKDNVFRDDVVYRHGLHNRVAIDESDPTHQHAIANAWALCSRAVSRLNDGK